MRGPGGTLRLVFHTSSVSPHHSDATPMSQGWFSRSMKVTQMIGAGGRFSVWGTFPETKLFLFLLPSRNGSQSST